MSGQEACNSGFGILQFSKGVGLVLSEALYLVGFPEFKAFLSGSYNTDYMLFWGPPLFGKPPMAPNKPQEDVFGSL